MQATREQLAAAFDKWYEDYCAEPESFDEVLPDGSYKDYGEACADTLCRYLDGFLNGSKPGR